MAGAPRINLDRVQFYKPPAPISPQLTTKTTNSARSAALTLPQKPAITAPAVHAEQQPLRCGHSPSEPIEIEDDTDNDSSSDDIDSDLSSTSEPATPTSSSGDTNRQSVPKSGNDEGLSTSNCDWTQSQTRSLSCADQAALAGLDTTLSGRRPSLARSSSPSSTISNTSPSSINEIAEAAISGSYPVAGVFVGAVPSPRQRPPPPEYSSWPDEEVPQYSLASNADQTRASLEVDMEDLDRALDGLINEPPHVGSTTEGCLPSSKMHAHTPPPSLVSQLFQSASTQSQPRAVHAQVALCPEAPQTATDRASYDSEEQLPTQTLAPSQESINTLLPAPNLERTRCLTPTHGNLQRSSARLRAIITSRDQPGSDPARRQSSNAATFDDNCASDSSEEQLSGSDEDYAPASLMGQEDVGNGGDGDGVGPASKRRRPLRIRDKSSSRRPSQRSHARPGARASHTHSARKVRTYGGVSPPPSQTSSDQELPDTGALGNFTEWPLPNASLKRVIVDGTATSQLQFTWDVSAAIGRQHNKSGESAQVATSEKPRDVTAAGYRPRPARRRKQASTPGKLFSEEEDSYLVGLKGRGQLSWKEIHQEFTKSYPGRSIGSLQVRYCTRLKGGQG